MSSTTRTTSPQTALNLNLLPKDKYDLPSITHLHTISPSIWTHLLLVPPTSPSPLHSPAIDSSTGLLTWLQDMHWPIARSVASLLLTLLNNSEYRVTHGMYLVSALRRLFKESEDWEWIRGVVVHVVVGVEDREWVRRELGGSLKGLKGRVEGDVDREWGVGEVINRISKDDEDNQGNGLVR